MITREQAENANEFHFGECKRSVGPKGGVKTFSHTVRRSGATKTWASRPNDFRIPVKYGLKQCGHIWHTNADGWHAAEDCPLLKQEG